MAGDRVGEGLSLGLALWSLDSGHQWVGQRMQRFPMDQRRNTSTQQDPGSRFARSNEWGGKCWVLGTKVLSTGVLRTPEPIAWFLNPSHSCARLWAYGNGLLASPRGNELERKALESRE